MYTYHVHNVVTKQVISTYITISVQLSTPFAVVTIGANNHYTRLFNYEGRVLKHPFQCCHTRLISKQPCVMVVNTSHHQDKQGGELNRNCNISIPDPLFSLIQYQNEKIAVWLHKAKACNVHYIECK